MLTRKTAVTSFAHTAKSYSPRFSLTATTGRFAAILTGDNFRTIPSEALLDPDSNPLYDPDGNPLLVGV